MRLGMTIEDATETMYWALSEPIGCLIYTSDPSYIMQVLYQARRSDPDLQELHIRQRPEGLVLWHTRNKGKTW